jgi:hypothetical protein
MKKSILFIFLILWFILPCASQTTDLGTYNPRNIPEEDLVTVYFDNVCNVQRVDNLLLEESNKRNKVVKLPPGQHSFYSRYSSSSAYTLFYVPVTATLEKGNTYKLSYGRGSSGTREFHIHLYNNKREGAIVSIERTDVQNLETLYINRFVEMSTSIGSSIRLENDNYVLIYKPENVYTLTDKKNNTTIEGSYLFSSISSSHAKFTGKSILYNEILPARQQRQQGSRHFTDAETILIPVKVTATEVIFLYEKPAELWGTELKFNKMEIIPK